MSRTPRQRLRLALLRAFARLSRAPEAHPARVIRRILVIRPDHLGDLLFTTPALRVLRQRYPGAHIAALVGPWGAPALANNPHVDELIRLPFPGFSRQAKPSAWQPYRLLRRWARALRGGYDLAFVLRFDHWWGALLAYLAGVPQRVGYALPEVRPFLSHAVPYRGGRHEVVQNLRLIDRGPLAVHSAGHQPTTYAPVNHPLEFPIPEPAVAWARDLWPDTRPIGIHPGAGAAVKLWQTERWVAIADALILLTGSEAERPLCLEIATQMETEGLVMAGKTTLDQLAATFAACRLVLGLDSGPLHLAVAVGMPSVHLYGPVDPITFGPWGAQERHAVVSSAWPCIPCNRLDYGPEQLADHPCMREIQVGTVLAAALRALSV
jgi:lipopolysaccharide heptosyltransferase II